jgi:hypothetical protein
MIAPIRHVFPKYTDEEHEEDFSFCLERAGELFEEKKDNSRAAKSEREERTVGKGSEEEWAEVVSQ